VNVLKQHPYLAEFIGTAILVIFGNGVVANVVLNRTKGHNGGWIVITAGWAMAVFIAVFCVAEASGAHLNPAVTIGLAAAGKFPVADGALASASPLLSVTGYIAAQMLGAIFGAVVVYFFYVQHFNATEDGAAKLACFSTGPNIPGNASALFSEIVGTFLLVFPIMLMVNPNLAMKLGPASASDVKFGLGALGALPVGLLVFGIGMSLGGTTGYAINPARDLGPRIAHAFLPIRKKGSSDWGYAWVPVVGPIIGGLMAGGAAWLLRL
jgi:glycerol uptake facilitator protein